MKVNTEVGYLRKSDIRPKKGDICGLCRDRGQDICELDEICHVRLAAALGKSARDISASIDYAGRRGLITIREEETEKGKVRFIKITDQGRVISGKRR
ncbi:MAG: hypothetical protein GXO65_05945 [Euryarchaeota archaeon]|nr:hypothetical protein [Euryarchaeota archaeon]